MSIRASLKPLTPLSRILIITGIASLRVSGQILMMDPEGFYLKTLLLMPLPLAQQDKKNSEKNIIAIFHGLFCLIPHLPVTYTALVVGQQNMGISSIWTMIH